MDLIFSKHFPAPMYKAICPFNKIYYRLAEKYRNRYRAHVGELFKLVEHERTHQAQRKEMTAFLFYLWYGIEWVLKIPTGRPYRNLSLEREARATSEDHDDYSCEFFYDEKKNLKRIRFTPSGKKGALLKRKRFAFVKYIFHE